MNLLLIPNSYPPQLGGLEVAVYNVAHHLARRGNEVTVVAGTSAIRCSKEIESDEVTVYRMPFVLPRIVARCGYKRAILSLLKSVLTPWTVSLTFFKLFLIVKSIKPDIINLHYIAENSLFCLAVRKFLKFKFVVNIHGEDIGWYLYRSTFARLLTKTTLRKADYVLSNSGYLLRRAEQICPAIENKSAVVGNGINLGRFKTLGKYQNDKQYILSIGNFVFKKGFDVLVQAFDIIHRRCLDVELLIAGDGLERHKCMKIASELGLDGSIKFLGKVEPFKIPILLNGCKMFVLPSRREPFGIVLLEAMMAGKPIVATRVGGVPEVVREDENAILVEPESPKALADGIMELLESPDLSQRFGRRGREIVKEFSWGKVADKYIAYYQQILKTGDGR